jgi:rare lipoprotein A
MTAAHRTARFGTRMRVTNLANGRSVVVRINNRGPFARGRVIDLSVSAARALGFVERGLTRVRLEPTEAPVSAVRTSDVNPSVRSPFEAKVKGPIQVATASDAPSMKSVTAAAVTAVAFPLPPVKPSLPVTVAANAPVDLVRFLALNP